MSRALLRHSSLFYKSCPCRCRYLAQSAFAHRSIIESGNPHNPEGWEVPAGNRNEKDNVEPSLILASSSTEWSTTLTSDRDVAATTKSPQRTKVDVYLASLRSAGLHPTLDDLERYRPRQHAHPSSPEYAKQYNELVDYLCRSFTKDQLRHLGILYDLEPMWTRPRRRKVEYAQAIIEKKWLWPCLKEIERKKRDTTEVVTQTFHVTPSQLFLLLGKDGSDLLQMSIDFNVHISLVSEPLSLKIEGLRGSLKLLTERISNLKKSTIEDTFQLPQSKPLPQNYLQRISRLSGAFIENVGSHGKIRICALDARNYSIAKRLASRATHYIDETTRVPLLSYMPAGAPVALPAPVSLFRHSYSLYPFLSHRPLPWTMNTGGVFRVRRVGEWLGQEPCENISRTGGLAKGAGMILTLNRDVTDLKQTLVGAMPEGLPDSVRTVTASTGHVLFPNSGIGQRATLVPPLKGHWPYSKILSWAATSGVQTSFIPSLPACLLTSPPSPQKILHRLVYHKTTSSEFTHSFEKLATPSSMLKFEILLAQPNAPSSSDTSSDTVSHRAPDSQDTSTHGGLTSRPQCWMGSKASVGLMMPDRPMDMHFLVEDLAAIAQGLEPTELQKYFNALGVFLDQQGSTGEQPEPSATLTFNGDGYQLISSTVVRQSTHVVAAAVGTECLRPVQIKHESILDLESNQKYVNCQTQCTNFESTEDWENFMTDCDRLTTFMNHSVDPSKPLGSDTTDNIRY